MWDKWLLLVAAFGGMLLFDGLALRGKLSARDKLVYGTIVALSLYAGIDFAMGLEWPDYLDLIDIPLGKAANAMEHALKVDWER